MEKVQEEFRNILDDADGTFEYVFKGKRNKDEIDQKDIKRKIKAFEELPHSSLVYDVKSLRTIFKDYEEDYILVGVKYSTFEETVEFSKGRINYFEKIELISNNKPFITRYIPGQNLTFRVDDSNKDLLYNPEFDILSYKAEDTIRDIKELKDANIISLTDEEKDLITIYKSFYNEDVDFTDKDTYSKMLSMVIILMKFGIYIDGYTKVNYKNINDICSFKLATTCNFLVSLGKVTVDEKSHVDDIILNRVESIGSEVRKMLIHKTNPVKYVESIAQSLFFEDEDNKRYEVGQKLIRVINDTLEE